MRDGSKERKSSYTHSHITYEANEIQKQSFFTSPILIDPKSYSKHPRLYSKLPTPIPPPPNLPRTNPLLHPHRQKPSYANPPTIAHARRPKTKLPLLPIHPLRDLRKGIHIYRAAQQSLPQHQRHDDPKAEAVGHPAPYGLRSEDEEVGDLEEGGRIEVVDAQEGC